MSSCFSLDQVEITILVSLAIFTLSMWLLSRTKSNERTKMTHWGYKESNGPHHWNDNCGYVLATPLGGRKQSPINLDTKTCQQDSSLTVIKVNYEEGCCKSIVNNGHSWQVAVEHSETSLTGGPLEDEYQLLQFHAHWGGDIGRGSEHTLNKKAYEAEMHLVHYNTKYEDVTWAGKVEDGLAVLGVFIQVGEEHPEFAKMIELLEQIQEPNLAEPVDIPESIDPSAFLPEDRTYMTYPGSLTTPPLSEVVTWIVFKQPIEMSQEQLAKMRSLRSDSVCGEDGLMDNYRPTQALGERTVRMFCPDKYSD